MNAITMTAPAADHALEKRGSNANKITVFHCFNSIGDYSCPENEYELKIIRLPCSGMTSDIVLLKAFEEGASAVIVLACPENTCHYLQGNIRARKRVERVKKLLDEAELGGRRLNFYNITPGDAAAVKDIISRTVVGL